ncbi:HisA/HisF-related TIM barrel protein [Actinomadura rubrisoli]|uniref:Imidazole glycerol phosphate synthase subunit HisF n=1 Tax=Actinomadura rubrisoli TaxID=2530368 RepID=A0A4R5APE8_9ACTN|nr:HisA/HisF-related TIM barrel protein [Actinomadura rubrisoli]TDD73670.1 imidazole glycerol phosphate synthase subunit HisF [Actinomadura rubrisoli]
MNPITWSNDDHPPVIPCLDIDHSKASTAATCPQGNTSNDPIQILDLYRDEGADKIFLDIQNSWEDSATILPLVHRLSTGGGSLLVSVANGSARDDHDIDALLEAGAAAVSLSTTTVQAPELVARAVSRHGGERILAVANTLRNADRWEVYIRGGKTPTGIDLLTWTRRVCDLGVGAVLPNSLAREGDTTGGYDLPLTDAVTQRACVPVIASGGCGSPEDMVEVLSRTAASYALAHTIFHRGHYSVGEAITACARIGEDVRSA